MHLIKINKFRSPLPQLCLSLMGLYYNEFELSSQYVLIESSFLFLFSNFHKIQ